MTNPCHKCSKKPNCPVKCYPQMDYTRYQARYRRKRRKDERKWEDEFAKAMMAR